MKDDKSTQLSESVRKLYSPEMFDKLGSQNERLKIKQQELEAMAATYLGEQYDRAKVKDVVAIQISTDIEQDKLLGRLDNNDLTEADYINQLECLFMDSAAACERILGAQDFERLFGIRSTDATKLIDRSNLPFAR
ncbi:MAG: hypothetical protein IVW56_03990 [Candidatus Binataceae bacterium]|nr:hypothetical protein [Candidatus Binataceae bacterium]